MQGICFQSEILLEKHLAFMAFVMLEAIAQGESQGKNASLSLSLSLSLSIYIYIYTYIYVYIYICKTIQDSRLMGSVF